MKRVAAFVVALVLVAALGGAGAAHAVDVPAQTVTAENFEVMLAVDVSGSMRGQAIAETKTAAVNFLAHMPPDVRIGLVTFGDSVSTPIPPTTDRAVLTQQINALVANSTHTLLYDGVITAVNSFTPAATNKAVVILSDGRDTGSGNQLAQAVASVQGDHVEAISLTTAETDLPALQALGTVTPADDPTALSAAFARVGDLLTKIVVPTTIAPTTAAPTTAAPTTAPPTTVAPPPTTAYVRPAPSVGALAPTHTTFPWWGAAAAFLGLAALFAFLWPRQRVSKARLGLAKPHSVSEMGLRTASAVDEFLERHGKRSELATSLAVADINVPAGQFVALVLAIAFVVGLVGLVMAGPFLALALAVAVCVGTRSYVRFKRNRRRQAFADQLPDVLQLLTTALRSGYSINQALDSVAEEAEEPARGEFAHVLVEARLGRDLADSLRAVAGRMQNVDLDWVVSAIDINRDTGGNLSEILGTVSETVRERQKMARQVNTLTAEGRVSARILTGLPVVMALWQWRLNPEAFSLLFEGFGLVLLLTGAFLLLIGWLWIRKIVNGVAL